MTAKKFALNLSIVWAVIAASLFGLAVGKVISLERFQTIFVTGFILWAILVTLATTAMSQKNNDDSCDVSDKRDAKD